MALAGAALAGCGEAATEAPAATKAATAAAAATTAAAAKAQVEAITLKIHGRLTPIDDMWAEDAAEYKKEHPNIKLIGVFVNSSVDRKSVV